MGWPGQELRSSPDETQEVPSSWCSHSHGCLVSVMPWHPAWCWACKSPLLCGKILEFRFRQTDGILANCVILDRHLTAQSSCSHSWKMGPIAPLPRAALLSRLVHCGYLVSALTSLPEHHDEKAPRHQNCESSIPKGSDDKVTHSEGHILLGLKGCSGFQSP